MLVFTRRRNDAIVIGDGIEVRVLRVGRDAVRLGVVAPPDVPVHRHEVYEQIRRENREAAAAGPRLAPFVARVRTLVPPPVPGAAPPDADDR